MTHGKICCECIYQVEDPKESKICINNPYQWRCRRGYWQDISICLEGIPGNHNWANKCEYHTKEK
jgi:hypothetical protein